MVGSTQPPPRLSIVTVVYNGAVILPGAIASVAAQRRTDVEYVVVDGGSTDGTVDLLRDGYGAVTRWISEPDRGIYDAMNKAVGLCRGDFILFLGADDRLRPCLDGLLAGLDDPTTIHYGDVWLVHAGKRYDGPFDQRKLLLRNICHQAICYPRLLLARHPFPLRYRLLADHARNLMFMGMGIPFVHLPIIITDFNDQGLSSADDVRFRREFPRLVRRCCGIRAYLWFRYRTLRNRAKRLLLELP